MIIYQKLTFNVEKIFIQLILKLVINFNMFLLLHKLMRVPLKMDKDSIHHIFMYNCKTIFFFLNLKSTAKVSIKQLFNKEYLARYVR